MSSLSFKSYVEVSLRKFIKDDDVDEFSYPEGLTHAERKYIHNKCRTLGLKSKSQGDEPHRVLTIQKERKANRQQFSLNLSEEASTAIKNYLERYGDTGSKHVPKAKCLMQVQHRFDKLHCGFVHPVTSNKFLKVRSSLPTWQVREQFLNSLRSNRVIIVSSETGSGKSTQLPQFILDEAESKKIPCKIICTQPRRLATVQIAERVAEERGEKVGCCVGFQIQLKSCLGPRTSLIYCTNGVFLRSLMGDYGCLNNITHVIVDEIHERDKYTDFLLICLKECLDAYPHLRLILMSATINVAPFQSYFPQSALFFIPGRYFSVSEKYLEDILLDFQEKDVPNRNVRAPPVRVRNYSSEINNWELMIEMNETISKCVEHGNYFAQLIYLIVSEDAPVNYQVPETGYSPLMAAAIHGEFEVVDQLLNLGADPFLTCHQGVTAAQMANRGNHIEVEDLLLTFQFSSEEVPTIVENDTEKLLCDYYKMFTEDIIDFDLILTLILHIRELDTKGSILVFLPGYDDILICQDKIRNSGLEESDYEIFILHGSMLIDHQHQVFKLISRQKIILATNIAETSLTIPDVVYVIDTGRVKEIIYDSLSGITSLETIWISQDSATQRMGRTGRTGPGICYRLYSSSRFNSFSEHRTPEILRVSLSEICLHVKKLASSDTTIAGFLNKALDKPPLALIQNSISSLKALGALDEHENLTVLGEHLLQLSVDPKLGKMLIMAVVFQCLDPILTIVSCLSQKDPFLIPHDPSLKSLVRARKQEFCEGALSDHAVLLRAFQMWQNAQASGNAKSFCNYHFLSPACMEVIHDIRAHLLSQLRASGFIEVRVRTVMQELNTHSGNWAIVKSVLATGLYPNVAFMKSKKFATKYEKVVTPHVTSSIAMSDLSRRESCLVYEEMSRIGLRFQIKCGTVVTPLTIALVCGKVRCASGKQLCLDDFLIFQNVNDELFQFMNVLENFIRRRISNPRNIMDEQANCLLRTLVRVLNIEDASYNFVAPQDLGKMPKLMHVRNLGNSNANKVGPIRSRSVSSAKQDNNKKRDKQEFAKCLQNGAVVPTSFHNGITIQRPTERKVLSLPGNLFVHSKVYFIIRPHDPQSLSMAINRGTWRFKPSTEKILFRKFIEGHCVILIFSVQKSEAFQALARLDDTNHGDVSRLPPISWLSTQKVSFTKTKILNMINRFNYDKPVHICQDGQEVEPDLGAQLCSLFYENCSVSSRPILGKHLS